MCVCVCVCVCAGHGAQKGCYLLHRGAREGTERPGVVATDGILLCRSCVLFVPPPLKSKHVFPPPQPFPVTHSGARATAQNNHEGTAG